MIHSDAHFPHRYVPSVRAKCFVVPCLEQILTITISITLSVRFDGTLGIMVYMAYGHANGHCSFRDSSMVEQRPVDWQLFAGRRIEKLRDIGEPLAF